MTEPVGWRDVRERGSVLGIRVVVTLATLFGRGPARALVALIALYYTATSAVARRAVRDFRARLGLPVGLGVTYRHILRFAQCALDALFFARGKTSAFVVTRTGHEHLAHLQATGQGAVLLGAHLGSFYAMRMQSEQEALALYPLVYLRNARRFNAVIEALDPRSTLRLLELSDADPARTVLAAREKIEQGGLVAILADRPPKQPPERVGHARTVEVDFLGGRATLPAGPFVLAAALRCPVYFTAGLYRGGARYDLYCEPFAERVELSRGERAQALSGYAQRYADTLARYCRDAPDNWFNFFDFWAPPDDGSARTEPARTEPAHDPSQARVEPRREAPEPPQPTSSP